MMAEEAIVCGDDGNVSDGERSYYVVTKMTIGGG